jgi:hypothetical protein
VIVDVANVMGSRPDGWWRDRAGAARRLYESVVDLSKHSEFDEFLLVLEGRAKAAQVHDVVGVRVVEAPGSGDETIVSLARSIPDALVVTADRELRRRCEQAGAIVHGPRWLTHQLPLRSLVINPTSQAVEGQIPMIVVAIVLIVVLACALYALDRALKAVVRGRRRRTAAERLFAAASVAEEKEKKRQDEENAGKALTSVMPAILEDKGPRKVA